MIDRRGLLAWLVAASAAGPAVAATPPRKPWGAPDFEGLWTNATYTELERPKELKSLVLSPDDAAAWEAKLARTGGVNVGDDPLGQASSEFPESGSGLLRVRGEVRSSLIVDPTDGKLPYSPAGKAAVGIDPERAANYDHPEARPDAERCLTSEAAGAPILPGPDTNVLQIVQTPDFIVFVSEKYHDARVVWLKRAFEPREGPSWLGQSVGRFEDDTLVVETANLREGRMEKSVGFYVTGTTRVVERFRRGAHGQIDYAFTVSDPTLFTQPWRGELVFTPSAGAIFEYACHEGNYSLVNILTAARLGRQDEEPKASAAPAGRP